MSLLARRASRPRGGARHPWPARAVPCAMGMAIAALIAALSMPGAGATATPRSVITPEYDLKAAFLFNFAQFVEWPADAFAAATTPITIGVLGDDPFGASLDALVNGETIRNRSLVVRRFPSVEQVDACHILFISASEA